jgi:hypothetical protein
LESESSQTPLKYPTVIQRVTGQQLPGTYLQVDGLIEKSRSYPTPLQGCASDTNIHFYSLSTDLQADWKYCHGTQPEILNYMHKVTDKYGLRQHCRFHTSLDKAEWDAQANVWRIETRNVRTGETQVTCATALIPAIGVLLVPKLPKLQGIESFKGALFHSARWRHEVDLHGKRVGVLGNGSSAYVAHPFFELREMSNSSSHWQIPIYPSHIKGSYSRLDQLRTYENVVCTSRKCIIAGVLTLLNLRDAKPIIPYRETTKWLFAYIPLVQRLYRFVIAASVCFNPISSFSLSDITFSMRCPSSFLKEKATITRQNL